MAAKMSDGEKIFKAREFKEKGNTAFKAGQTQKAIGSYHRAILYIKSLSSNSPDMIQGMAQLCGQDLSMIENPKMTPDMEEEVRRMTCDCHNNLAACLLKEESPKYERIVDLCDKALDSDPHNIKALYRKGTSLYKLEEYEEALDTLQQAVPDPSVTKPIDLCKAAIKNQDKKLAQNYKRMFNS